jgi:hypothetical protein
MFVGKTLPATCAQCGSGDIEARIAAGHTPASGAEGHSKECAPPTIFDPDPVRSVRR